MTLEERKAMREGLESQIEISLGYSNKTSLTMLGRLASEKRLRGPTKSITLVSKCLSRDGKTQIFQPAPERYQRGHEEGMDFENPAVGNLCIEKSRESSLYMPGSWKMVWEM